MGNVLSLTDPNTSYMTYAEANQQFLTPSQANSQYVNSTALQNYYTKTDSDSRYLTPSQGNTLYATSSALQNYLSKTEGDSRYLPSLWSVNFSGVGQISNSWIDIINTGLVGSVNASLNMSSNLFKTIRIWYNVADSLPIGWGISSNWTYPVQFNNAGYKSNILTAFNITSALEMWNGDSSSNKWKILLWFYSSIPSGIPLNNPREAVKWIVTNRPSTLVCQFGADALSRFLGMQYFNASVRYGTI